MKPDWKDAPEWANYFAMDPDGRWYWFENEPEFTDQEWYADGKYAEITGLKSNGTLGKRP